MWLLPAFSAVCTAAARVFYRLEISGPSVPTRGPVLLVANHPNSLLDPVLVSAVAGRPVRFLAKAPLFSDAKIGWLIRGSGAIPVYRKADDPSATGQNVNMFRGVFDALGSGAAVGIFPEGISHSEASITPLKTGAARIALGTGESHGAFPIVPIGIVLRNKEQFRSEALVVRGKPLAWDDLSGRSSEDRDAAGELTTRIDDALRTVTVNLAQWQDAPLVECAEAVWAAEHDLSDSSTDRIERLRTTTAVLARLREGDEMHWTALARDLNAHRRRLRILNLTPGELRGDLRARSAIKQLARRFYVFGVPALLIGAVGYVLLWVPFRLTGWVSRKTKPDPDQVATHKLLYGAILYAVWILVIAGAVGWWKGWPTGLLAAIALPFLGVISRRVRERWLSLGSDVTRFLAARRRGETLHQLRAQQRELAQRLEQTLAESL